MATIKHNKPEAFEGQKNALAVNGCPYQFDLYLNLLQVDNPQVSLDEIIKIYLPSSFMREPAAHWCSMMVHGGQGPGRWDDFVARARAGIILKDAVQSLCDKLRTPTKRTNISAYLNQFQNLVTAIPGIIKYKNIRPLLYRSQTIGKAKSVES